MYRYLPGLTFLLSIPAYCAEGPFVNVRGFDDYVDRGARILFVGAHPDDESLAGPLLADACVQKGNDCHIASFTRGGGGTCGRFLTGCTPDLATVRTQEMQAVAERYGIGLDLGDFSNQPPRNIKETPEAIRAVWETEGNPRRWLTKIIERFQPDVLITLDPDGFTGHAEHRLASVLVNEVMYPEKGKPPGPKHLTVFHVLNRYQSLEPLLGNDPAIPTETWDLSRTCGRQTCVQMAMDIAREHRSQLVVSALALFVLFADRFEALHLRKLSAPNAEE